MPSLEALVYGRLTGDAELAGLLAGYRGYPAVFELVAPPDSDPGWSGSQTPRIQYDVTRAEDPERRVDGEFTITIVDAGQTMAIPADIDNRVRQILDEVTLRADEGTVSLHWQRSDPFDEGDEFRGIETVFDVIAWPAGLTYDPDPVATLRSWSASNYPVIQVDPDTWAPSDATPALYWRISSVAGVDRASWGAWLTVQIQGHVLASTPGGRLPWIRRITEGLARTSRVSLSDGSPLLFQAVSADSDADPLRTGQLRLTARFGILGQREPAGSTGDLLRQAHTTDTWQ